MSASPEFMLALLRNLVLMAHGNTIDVALMRAADESGAGLEEVHYVRGIIENEKRSARAKRRRGRERGRR